MNKRVLLTVFVVITVIMIISGPVLASVYRYTSTSFRYIGDMFHEREILFDGPSTDARYVFQVSGRGFARGTQDTHHVVREVYDGVDELIVIFSRFEGTTDINAALDEHVLIITTLDIQPQNIRATLNTGVEMDPGESGYIDQHIVSKTNPDGEYLRMVNQFGNTGGRTAREMEVENYMYDALVVDGYAEVYEWTEVKSGDTRRTGWWNRFQD